MIFNNVELEDSDFKNENNLCFPAVKEIVMSNFGNEITFFDFFIFDSRVKSDVRFNPLSLQLNKIFNAELSPSVVDVVSRDYNIIKKSVSKIVPEAVADGLDFYMIESELRFCLPEFLEKNDFLKKNTYVHKLTGDDLTLIKDNHVTDGYDSDMILVDFMKDKKVREAFLNIQVGADDPEIYAQELE